MENLRDNETDNDPKPKKLNDKDIRKRKIYLDSLRKSLSTADGRRTLWEILSMCGVYKNSAVPSGSFTYFNEGQRSIGIRLITDINEIDPDVYFKMSIEARKEV